ncbi:hypothetical protein H4219_001590 [Mycoemilia scoparia]|uniref:N-acetyltransferase domain-containing protein n=1 Tax=Mycoemilia scoparia TaxID=417184 RepID=A0A9W8A5K8_9FUNG|nr:hypothetical protein H4219_001590 [Mycoemilia scoparia]
MSQNSSSTIDTVQQLPGWYCEDIRLYTHYLQIMADKSYWLDDRVVFANPSNKFHRDSNHTYFLFKPATLFYNSFSNNRNDGRGPLLPGPLVDGSDAAIRECVCELKEFYQKLELSPRCILDLTFSPSDLIEKTANALTAFGFNVDRGIDSTVMMLETNQAATDDLHNRFGNIQTKDNLTISLADWDDLESMVNVNAKGFQYKPGETEWLSTKLGRQISDSQSHHQIFVAKVPKADIFPKKSTASGEDVDDETKYEVEKDHSPSSSSSEDEDTNQEVTSFLVCFKSHPEADTMLVQLLVTDPDFQRRGHATALMLEAIEAQPKNTRIYLEVVEDKAMRLYSSLGFKEVGTLRLYECWI